LPHPAGVALVLAPCEGHRGATARLGVAFDALGDGGASRCRDAGLEALRTAVPAARALPLLEAIARGERASFTLPAIGGMGLRIDLESA